MSLKQMTWKLLLTLYPILGLDQLIKTLKMKAFIPSAQIPVWAYFAHMKCQQVLCKVAKSNIQTGMFNTGPQTGGGNQIYK